MPSTVLADTEHACSTQVADDTPNRAACQEESFGEVAYSAVLVCCDTEQHGAVAGDVVPAVIGIGRELRLPHSRTRRVARGLIIVKYVRESSPRDCASGRGGCQQGWATLRLEAPDHMPQQPALPYRVCHAAS